MEIQIFKEVTTEDALAELETSGIKYSGLYVDMDDKDSRVYVKNEAAKITDILKRLDRARIDTAKNYKVMVESEAKSIRERLELANKPFTLLLDAHKEKRTKELADKKAEDDAKAAYIQKQADHELALLMNNEYDRNYDDMIAEREKAEQARLDEIELQKTLAAEDAVKFEKENQARIAENNRLEKIQRENDRAYVSEVRRSAKESLMQLGIDEEKAKEIVLAIHNDQIANVSIKY